MPKSLYALMATVSMFSLSTATLAFGQENIELKEIVIDGSTASEGAKGVITTQGYVAKSGRTATKTDTPLIETPQSISTVTQQQLEDRKPQALLDALNYTPGVRTGQFGFDPRYDAFTIRGIDATYNGVFRDGMRQLNSPNGLFRLEPYGLEAISILKGPSASIYGASSSGGIVDLITKRPTETVLREIELQGGSFDRLQGAFDFSGPLDQDKTLLYRLTGLVRDAGTDIDAVSDDRVYIAPALTWQPDGDTKFTLLGEYMDSTTGGTAAYINNYSPAGNSTGATHEFAGDERFNDFSQKQGRIGYELDQRLTETITLHHKLRYSDLSTRQEYSFGGYPGLVEEDTGGIVSDTYLETEFETGAVEHRLVTGADFSWLDLTSREGNGAEPFTDSYSYAPALTQTTKQERTQFGIYAQDQIAYDQWRLTLGLRHDWLDSDMDIDDQGVTSSFARNDSETTGRAALAYVTPFGITPYVSYGTSFVANAGVIQSGQPAVPTTGHQAEAGMKYDIPGHNAFVTTSVFDIRQDNGVVFEASGNTNEQIQLDLRSRGFEIEGTASFDNGLSLTASYSYTDVEILRLTDATAGKTLNSSPYHMASVWVDYAFQEGPLNGLGIGAGVRYVGSSFGDNVHTPVLDNKPRTLVDASLRYDFANLNPAFKDVRLQVNATNLLNDVKQVCSNGYCFWDEGRKVIASMRYRF